MINRTFRTLSRHENPTLTDGWDFDNHDAYEGLSWDDLYRWKRILLVSEAGAGKTHECEKQAANLFSLGNPAFYINLSQLALTSELSELIEESCLNRFDAWVKSQSDVATFFLDSLDELSLSDINLDTALRRFKKLIEHQYHKAQIVITSRPTRHRLKILETHLPVPKEPIPADSLREKFASTAMGETIRLENRSPRQDQKDWIAVTLDPLTTSQIRQLASKNHISKPDEFMNKMANSGLEDFLTRPIDVVNLIEDWKNGDFFRKYSKQIRASISRRLSRSIPERREPTELSIERAGNGARKLALSLLLLNRQTLRSFPTSDGKGSSEASIEPSAILTDWTDLEIKALLQRPLFEFSSPGCVKIHHRSILEYLGAQELSSLLETGLGISSLVQILFASSDKKFVVRSESRGAMAAWLASENSRVYEILRDNQPELLMTYGDPGSLLPEQCQQVLLSYVKKYGDSNIREMTAQSSQLRRFATPKLATVINGAWQNKPTNIRVRLTLLAIIEAAKVKECSEIAFQVATDSQVSGDERLAGLKALVAINDPRIASIPNDIAANNGHWTADMAAHGLNLLFPLHCNVNQFCQSISWIADSDNLGTICYPLRWAVSRANLSKDDLEILRDRLVELASDGIKWNKEPPRVISKRPELAKLLALVCQKGLKVSTSEAWLYAALLSIHLFDHNFGSDHIVSSLRNQLQNIDNYENLRLTEVKLLFKLSSNCRLFYTCDQLFLRDETLSFSAERDLGWLKKGLANSDLNLSEREKLLDCVKYLVNLNALPVSVVLGLKQTVCGQPSLVKKVEEALSSHSPAANDETSKKKQLMNIDQKSHHHSDAFQSWKQFYDEIASDLEKAFSPEKEKFTAYNLWRAMVADSTDNEATSWNRRFIEDVFDKDVADKLRSYLMGYWRSQCPKFPSERSESERQSYPNSWLLGLAGIYAEAEDENWVSNLSDDEARLAVRYSLVAYRSIPSWLSNIAERFPEIIQQLLGGEISFELRAPFKHSYLLQEIGYADTRVATLLVSKLLDWLSDLKSRKEWKLKQKETRRIALQVVKIIVKHGSPEKLDQLVEIADALLEKNIGRDFDAILLRAIFKVAPENGLAALERKLQNVKVSQRSKGVYYFASVFGDSLKPIDLQDPRFTPRCLNFLLNLAFSHVRPVDDVDHSGLYSPDERDDAQTARHMILSAFNNAHGDEAYRLKVKAVADPLFNLQSCDNKSVVSVLRVPEKTETFKVETEVADFIKKYELPLKTNEAMSSLLRERIEDIRELLKEDLSPRRIWAKLDHENLLRTVIAIELKRGGSSIYTVTQEEQTSEEKRTDIRLKSKHSKNEAVIEVKRFEKNSLKQLKVALRRQLVGNYLRPKCRRAGILLITLSENNDEGCSSAVAKKRTNHKTRADKMIVQLQKEIYSIKDEFDGELFIEVELLDLRNPTRRSTNEQSKSKTKKQ